MSYTSVLGGTIIPLTISGGITRTTCSLENPQFFILCGLLEAIGIPILFYHYKYKLFYLLTIFRFRGAHIICVENLVAYTATYFSYGSTVKTYHKLLVMCVVVTMVYPFNKISIGSSGWDIEVSHTFPTSYQNLECGVILGFPSNPYYFTAIWVLI